MRSLVQCVRGVRCNFIEAGVRDHNRARDCFFSFIITAALSRILLGGSDVKNQQLSSNIDRLLSIFPDLQRWSERLESQLPLLSQISGALDEIVGCVVDDPLALGWSYQIWNEDERDASTWAVSRKGDTALSSHAIAAATQIFTEDYMASFVVKRCLKLKESGGAPLLLDPACGTGHILVHALRAIHSRDRGHRSEMSSVIESVHGCDIDPFAVDLCRMVLLIEAIKGGCKDVGETWRYLCKNVVHLSSPHGSLERHETHPLLEKRYGIVVTNPPYIGRRKLPEEFRCFLDTEYPATAMDLCSAFIERCLELVEEDGALGVVTVDKWLRLRGYECFRTGGREFPGIYHSLSLDVVCELGCRAFSPWSSLHDGVGIALLTARLRPPAAGHTFNFLSCAELLNPTKKAQALSEFDAHEGMGKRVKQASVMIPGGSTRFVAEHGLPENLLTSGVRVAARAQVIVGLQTNDDRTFVRYIWSVPPLKERWRVHSKGGGYGKWFGFNRYLLDWGGGQQIFERNSKSGVFVQEWFEKEGWTYTWFANGALGLRRKERGWSFGRAAASGFFCDDPRIIGLLNSRIGSLLVRRVGGKAQLPEGVVRSLPLPPSYDAINPLLIEAAVAVKRAIVQHDMTDIAFVPESRWEPLAPLYLNALLLAVEGAIELQVQETLGLSVREQKELELSLGIPVAWHRASSPVRSHALWAHIPPEFASIRDLLVDSAVRPHGMMTAAEVINQYYHEEAAPAAAPKALPSTSLVELIARVGNLHPFDVAEALGASVSQDLDVCKDIVGRDLHRQIIEIALSELGHQWWSSVDRYDPSQHREVSGKEIANAVRTRISSIDHAEILGETLESWIEKRLFRLHEQLFQREPIMIQRRHGKGDCTFRHVWSISSVPERGILESQVRHSP